MPKYIILEHKDKGNKMIWEIKRKLKRKAK
jgi:hypothetical protein